MNSLDYESFVDGYCGSSSFCIQQMHQKVPSLDAVNRQIMRHKDENEEFNVACTTAWRRTIDTTKYYRFVGELMWNMRHQLRTTNRIERENKEELRWFLRNPKERSMS